MPTTTPSVWLSRELASIIPASSPSEPVITSLSNGNILVVWTEYDDTVAPNAGSDIVGVIFDAQGNIISDMLTLNDGFGFSRSEYSPSVAATDDGGFVLVYQFPTGNEEDIIFGRYDAEGARTQSTHVVNDTNTVGLAYRNANIVARPDGTFFVSYERDEGTDESIVARTISASGVVGSEFVLRPDDDPTGSTSDPHRPVSATLTNGSVVTAYLEDDGGLQEIEVVTVSAAGTVSSALNFTGSTISNFEPHIAALTGGGFIVVWERDGQIFGRLGNSSGSSVGSELTITAGSDNQNEPVVIGLQDGGFFVAWDDDTDSRLEGRRFDSNGVAVGGQVTIANVGETSPELDLTTDGRIVVSYQLESNTDVEITILDPRDDDFTLQSSGVATTRVEGGTVYGSHGIDIIYGQGGIDTIYGSAGNDILYGGANRDYLGGGGGEDTMIGGQGNDVFVVGSAGDVIVETPGNGEDSVRSTISYTLNIELEHLNLLGNANLNGIGNNKGNILQGNNGRNVLSGLKGDDIIKGFDDRDGLVGNDGADRLFGMQGNDVLRGDLGADILNGGAGDDRFVYRSITDSTVNASQRDTIQDFTSGADRIDLRQIDASNSIAGDQAFTFIGGAGFSGGGGIGQVRFNNAPTGVMVAVDSDGNGSGDMLILVEGVTSLSASDFLL